MNQAVIQVIKQRFSCRIHSDIPVERETQSILREFLEAKTTGPFGAHMRFALIASTDNDNRSLKGLGTYGFIKGAKGFIVGALGPGEKNLEDFGYQMEHAILVATELGLGTCWLGGSFTKSSFARRINAKDEEIVPAVVSLGYIDDRSKSEDWIRRKAGGAFRMPPEQLFFEENFGEAIHLHSIGNFEQVLEMVRWAPSASNKQPWRIVHTGDDWHFYLHRTKGYGKSSMLGKLLGVADLQRVDMGIAMCHFELSARELGLNGNWTIAEPDIDKPDEYTEYIASWRVSHNT